MYILRHMVYGFVWADTRFMGRALTDLDCEGFRRAGICSERAGPACADFDFEACRAGVSCSALFRRLGAERCELERRSSAE